MDFDTYCRRFYFAADMNGDLVVSISDVALWLKSAFLLPSTLLASFLHRGAWTSTFFEVDCTTGQGWGGAIFSAAVWFYLLLLLAASLSKR